jgi:hypothetical protein
LIEAALLRHFDQLTERTHALVAGTNPAMAWRTLVRAMIETGATKLTLASMLAGSRGFPNSAATASNRLKAAVSEVLHRAQDSGAVQPSVTIEEVYLLIRALAQASATMQARPDTWTAPSTSCLPAYRSQPADVHRWQTSGPPQLGRSGPCNPGFRPELREVVSRNADSPRRITHAEQPYRGH